MPLSVLFICNGNVARSQEAEAFCTVLGQSQGISAESAGINVKVGQPLDPLVIAVMDEAGYDMSAAYRKLITPEMVTNAKVLISFKPFDELPDYARTRNDLIYWNVDDPRHQPVSFHRRVRDEIKLKVSELIGALSNEHSKSSKAK